MEKIIEVKNLKIVFDSSKKKVITVPHWIVNKNEFWLIIGGNGTGKTSILYSLTGVIPLIIKAKIEGSITVTGRNPRKDMKEIFSKVGLILQNPYDQLTEGKVENEIIFPLENLGVNKSLIKEKLENALNIFSLNLLRERNPLSLSSGEGQKTLLASIFAKEPLLFLLDEPEAHLDFVARKSLFQIVEGLLREEGKTIVISTHSPEHYIHLDPRILFLTPDKKGIVFENVRDMFERVDHNWLRRLSYSLQFNYSLYIQNRKDWKWQDCNLSNGEILCQ